MSLSVGFKDQPDYKYMKRIIMCVISNMESLYLFLDDRRNRANVNVSVNFDFYFQIKNSRQKKFLIMSLEKDLYLIIEKKNSLNINMKIYAVHLHVRRK